MIAGVQALRRGVGVFRQNGYAYVWANVAFIVLCVPIFTAPAALSALFRVSHAAFTEPHEADLALFWETFRENLWKALPWGLAHAAFVVINFSNLHAYAGDPRPLFQVLRVVWLLAGIVWAAALLYTWPLYYEMQQPSLYMATRNALIMVLQNPLFTITMLTSAAIIILFSLWLLAAWVLLTFGALAMIGSAAVLDRLQVFRSRGKSAHGLD